MDGCEKEREGEVFTRWRRVKEEREIHVEQGMKKRNKRKKNIKWKRRRAETRIIHERKIRGRRSWGWALLRSFILSSSLSFSFSPFHPSQMIPRNECTLSQRLILSQDPKRTLRSKMGGGNKQNEKSKKENWFSLMTRENRRICIHHHKHLVIIPFVSKKSSFTQDPFTSFCFISFFLPPLFTSHSFPFPSQLHSLISLDEFE